MRSEGIRKAVHTALALLFAWGLGQAGHTCIVVSASLLLLLFIVVRLRVRLPSVTHLFRSTYGELFFVLGVLVSLYLSYPAIYPFQIAMVILGLADTSASLVGMTFGATNQYKLFGEKRSVQGSLACLFVSYCVLLFFGVSSFIGICIACCVTIVEALSPRGSDNFFIPVTVVILISLLG